MSLSARQRLMAGAALLVLATSFAYAPALNGGFILDDDRILTENPLIRDAAGICKFWFTTQAIDYWPMTNTSLWLEWRLWGMTASGYHVTNIVLHIVETFLLWAILRRLAIPGAFVAALLFAVHPVNVQSVAWITQRKNLMAMLFLLLSTLGYLKSEAPAAEPPSPRRTDPWYWLSLVAFVLAMLSKASVAVLPILLLVIVGWSRPLTRRDSIRVAPFLLVSAALVPVNIWFQARAVTFAVRDITLVERLLGAAGVVWFYLAKALLPIDLAFVYPRWHVDPERVEWWIPLLAAVAVTAVLWRYRHRWGRPVLFAWAYFCVALAPVMGFTSPVFMVEQSLVADHYQHIALIGVVVLVAAGWATWRKRCRRSNRRWVDAAAAAAAGTLAVLTWQQSTLYRDNVTLFRATVAQNPDSALAHNNAGVALLQAGRLQEGKGHIEEALRLRPDYAGAYNNLGGALVQAGQREEALAQFRHALRLQPKHFGAQGNLGATLLEMGRLQEAIEHSAEALRLQPDFPEAHCTLGKALFRIDRVDEAIEHFRQALRSKPDFSDAHNALGAALLARGQNREAVVHFEEALRLRPDDGDARHNLEKARTALRAEQVG